MISVIIVNYNSADLIKRAVESVFQENEDIEVFIVDNTSTFQEQEQLHNIFDAQKVNLIFNESNIGFAKACNQAFSYSRGEYIFLLNPDAYLIPPCLSLLREFLEDTPDAASVSPLIYWDSNLQYIFPYMFLPSPVLDFYMKLSQLSQIFGYLCSLYGRWKNIGLWKSSLPVKVKNLSGGTIMLKRSAIQKTGFLFDDSYFLFYEDNDLFLRLMKAGYELYVVPAAKAVHSYKHTKIKLDIMTQSRNNYYEKNFSNSLSKYISQMIPNHTRKDEYPDSGTWNTPPFFTVPEDLTEGYIFEWSFNHLFIPAVGYFGQGKTLAFPQEIWDSLDSGKYFSRFSDCRKSFGVKNPFVWSKV